MDAVNLSDETRMDLAEDIVTQILNDLQERSGIGNELDAIDDDIKHEMELDLRKLVLTCLRAI